MKYERDPIQFRHARRTLEVKGHVVMPGSNQRGQAGYWFESLGVMGLRSMSRSKGEMCTKTIQSPRQNLTEHTKALTSCIPYFVYNIAPA